MAAISIWLSLRLGEVDREPFVHPSLVVGLHEFQPCSASCASCAGENASHRRAVRLGQRCQGPMTVSVTTSSEDTKIYMNIYVNVNI